MMNKILLLLIFELMMQSVCAQTTLKIYTNYNSTELVCEVNDIENKNAEHFDKLNVTAAKKHHHKKEGFIFNSFCVLFKPDG